MMYSGFARTGQGWWLGSPSSFNKYGAYARHVGDTSGTTNAVNVYKSVGLRPTIVLKPGVEISGGDGTYNNPYVVDTTSS